MNAYYTKLLTFWIVMNGSFIPAFWHLRWTFWLLGHHVTMDNKSRDRTVSMEMESFRPTCTKLLLVSNHTLSTTLSKGGMQLEKETLFKKSTLNFTFHVTHGKDLLTWKTGRHRLDLRVWGSRRLGIQEDVCCCSEWESLSLASVKLWIRQKLYI